MKGKEYLLYKHRNHYHIVDTSCIKKITSDNDKTFIFFNEPQMMLVELEYSKGDLLFIANYSLHEAIEAMSALKNKDSKSVKKAQK